ncbi:hypothetical protein LEP1GSC018_0595 [Leptospira kirschneri str. 2008720114]|nr:hypothetical protein LEP1GSC018_0595 [Leptospira kirschneri str. 2008720114]
MVYQLLIFVLPEISLSFRLLKIFIQNLPKTLRPVHKKASVESYKYGNYYFEIESRR